MTVCIFEAPTRNFLVKMPTTAYLFSRINTYLKKAPRIIIRINQFS